MFKSQIANRKSQIANRQSPIALWMMVMLIAAAFALRVYHLGASDLTFDECASAFNSGKPYAEMMRYLVVEAFHELPPAYYVLLRAWRFVAGHGEFALRYPSVLLGVLAVALIYRLGRRGLHPPQLPPLRRGRAGGGMVAAGLLALQPFHWYYSQDARPYTLMVVEAILMVYFFDRLCREPKWRWWIAFGATGAVAVLTHYFMAFLVAALCVYLALHVRAHWRLIPVWFGGLAMVGAVMLIWLVTSRAGRLVRRVLLGMTWRGLIGRLAPAQRMLTDVMFGPISHPAPEWIMFIAALALIGLLVAIARPWRTLRPGGRWLLPAWLIVPIVLLVLVPERLEARYNAAILPAYCLALALVVTWLWERKVTRWLAPVALGTIFYLQVSALLPAMNVIKSDYGHVVAYLNQRARPGDALILNGDWQWVQQLYYPARPDLPKYTLPPMTPPGLDPAQARPVLEKVLATYKRIWVLPAAVTEADPKRFVAGWLNEHAYFASSYHELSLYYVGEPTTAVTPLNPPIRWGDWVELTSVRWTRNQTVPGEPLLLDLDWRVLRAPGRSLRLRLDLADRNGGVWYSTQLNVGQYYAPPETWQADQRITTRVGLPVPLGTPPGAFDVRVNIVGSNPSTGGEYATLSGARVLPCSDEHPCPPTLAEDFTPLGVAFGDGFKLAGYQTGGKEFVQGRFAAITLYWQAERPLADGVTERVALVDRNGQVVAQTEGPLVADWYPPSQWKPGQLLADPQVILIPPKLAPGEYSFRVGLITAEGQTSGQSLDVGRVRILARDRQFRAGPISHPLKVEFGDQVRLLGYDVKLETGQVRLTLYWQALREMDENYTVFTHVVDIGGGLAGQKDSWPHEGDYPTSFWMRGEVVKDEYIIPFDAAVSAHHVKVGLYDAAIVRLPAVSAGVRLANDAVVIPLRVER